MKRKKMKNFGNKILGIVVGFVILVIISLWLQVFAPIVLEDSQMGGFGRMLVMFVPFVFGIWMIRVSWRAITADKENEDEV